MSLAFGAQPCVGADVWGGSLALTSDYIVRGISRSDNDPALQLDLHYLNTSGFVAGLFASTVQIRPGAPKDVELDAFLGYAWAMGGDWRGKVLANHYAYPGSHAGSGDDYDELDLDLAYQEWLDFSLSYSPNGPRYSTYGAPAGYGGLAGASCRSAEVNVQRPILGKLSATGGIGYSQLGGQYPGGYTFWSVGAAYNFAPVSLVLSYVDTTAEAKALFYNAAVGGRWTGTVVWRF
jgi:uncharacterized protein (TIGR02001 family)